MFEFLFSHNYLLISHFLTCTLSPLAQKTKRTLAVGKNAPGVTRHTGRNEASRKLPLELVAGRAFPHVSS